jgi:hypothetical protein
MVSRGVIPVIFVVAKAKCFFPKTLSPFLVLEVLP